MMATLTEDAIEDFLKTCRKEIKKGNCYFVANRELKIKGRRKKAMQALYDLNIMSIDEIWDYILQLKKEDCIDVTFDHDSRRDTNSEIFIFKKKINGKNVYIKLTMRTSGIICISFHEDS